MELKDLDISFELSNSNKKFIIERSIKYKTYSKQGLNKKIINTFCVLLALLKARDD